MRLRRSLCRWRDCKGKPSVPAFGAVLSSELPITFQVQIPLHIPYRKKEPYLWADAGDTGFETSDAISGPTVTSDLVVEIADSSSKKLFRKKLRRTPVHMQVNAVLIVGACVHEIVSKARDYRKFVPLCWVEIGVAYATIELLLILGPPCCRFSRMLRSGWTPSRHQIQSDIRSNRHWPYSIFRLNLRVSTRGSA